MRITVNPLDDDVTISEPELLTGVLARSSAELADLADRTERLQDVMAALVKQCAALDHDATRDMQALDWVAQHLEGLASFLEALSKAAPPGWRIDTGPALDALNLAELAHRLRGGSAGVMVAPAASSGDMELF